MPNHRTTPLTPVELETAHPWTKDRWAEAEPQVRRGPPGSRGVGDVVRPRESHEPTEWSGVRPLPPILPSMPRAKPGDQGG
jgi:hypothetical protein